MEKFELIVPTIFGLESFTAREIRRLGYETTQVEDGRITFLGDWEAVCKANLWIRTGERVLIKVAEFDAVTFDELFEGTKAQDWSKWLPKDCAFPVKGFCLKSQLASMRDCQAIIKKAVVDSLSSSYGISWFSEEGNCYQIQFSVLKDKVTLMIDTSGPGLHKRGYRETANAAPLKETIASAMVLLSYWKYEYPLADPFCGSGTIPIEAAMIKRNMAPGLTREFAAQGFEQMPPELWETAREAAKAEEKEIPLEIYASDIDPASVEIAKENARIAGLDAFIKPVQGDAGAFSSAKAFGTIITNPPYGERLSDAAECERLYKKIGSSFQKLDRWSYYILASHEDFERFFGRKADKKRKIYNGMIRCNIYQYFGPKPPKPTAY
jgi:putative N6-adenine-specific DNA methylase